MKKDKNSDWIVDFIREQTDRPHKIKELARLINISHDDYPHFRRVVKDLIGEGRLVRLKRGRIGLPDQMDLITGILTLTKGGFGFVRCDRTAEEIFVGVRNLHTAFNGDRVLVRLKPGHGFRGKREGVIIDIIERRTAQIVGTLVKSRGYSYVIPDAKNFQRDINIVKGGTLRSRDGEKVVVKLDEWSDPYRHPEGKVVERIGFPGEPGVDTLSIIRSYNLPTDFSNDVLSEAKEAVKNWEQEANTRIDLTRLRTFTIDPADARDHDDAVSIEMSNGNYKLGVHIADVSHFVQAGTKLDMEAFERGTSVYFPDRVIPMLPEILSNDACSLRPNRKRLALTVIMEFDSEGKVAGYEIYPSVIKSRAKLSYREVQEIFDGEQPDNRIRSLADDLVLMRKLARILYRRRDQAGSLDFDLPEAKIILDEEGKVIEIGNRIRTESHRLIEEFMLAANRQVALHFFRMAQPILYRVHEKPDMEKLQGFSEMMKKLGYRFPVSANMPTRDFSRFINKIKGRPEEELINELMLRSMKKAIYQPKNVGHFGLAFTHYLHFTSPIRRYPDLLVHRLLKCLKNDRYPVKLARKLGPVLENVGKHSSDLERRAMEAEREAVRIKQVIFMAQKLGEEYDGIIAGVLNFGFFVRLIGPGCEGLVRASTIDDDYYAYDETGYRLVGRRKGRIFRLGDKVRVGVLKVDPEEKEIDLYLVEPQRINSKVKGKRTRKKNKKKQR
jgi:ribonuclease R